ncbi:hypothetical protein ABFA07_016613 [Porites harrisoni]
MADAPASLQKVKNKILQRGGRSIKRIARTFRIYDDDGSKNKNFEEFKEGLKDYGLDLSNEGNLEGPSLAVVKEAFKRADKTGDGVVTFEDLKGVYKATEHPKYKNGEWSEEQVFKEFLESFEPDPSSRDGKVTEREFLDYYAAIGANIDNDAYFELMMRNAWKI